MGNIVLFIYNPIMLSDKDLNQVSKLAGISYQAARRLLGDVYVPDGQESGKCYNLGLGLAGEGTPQSRIPAMDLLVESLSEYRRVCPIIFGWLCRGDFSPEKRPENATKAIIIHSCRTARRLKAKYLRSIS